MISASISCNSVQIYCIAMLYDTIFHWQNCLWVFNLITIINYFVVKILHTQTRLQQQQQQQQQKSKLGMNWHCGILCATVTRLFLNECRKQANQVYSLLCNLSNSASYEWLSLLTHSTVLLYLNFLSFTYLNLSSLSIKNSYCASVTQVRQKEDCRDSATHNRHSKRVKTLTFCTK